MEQETNLHLVKHGLRFLESTHTYSSDRENTRFMVYLPNESREETRAFLLAAEEEWEKESPSFYEFAILLGKEHIGAVSLYLNKERDTGELGWILDKRYWGHGYACQAAERVMAFGRDTLKITHFVAHCDSENAASRRVMEKLGMKRTCVNENRKNRSSPENRREYQYELETGVR